MSEPAPDPAPDPFPDAATDRLRALLRQPEPWPDRWRDRLAAALPAGAIPIRPVVVVVGAVALGTLAFLAFGSSRASSIDPVQVLPGAAPTGSAGVTGSPPTTPAVGGEPVTAPPGSLPVRIRVHAAGAVELPGVHELHAGDRVSDLIASAGGLRSDADPDRINLAAPVTDGERVYVPRLGEAGAPPVVAGGGPVAGPVEPSSSGGGSAPSDGPAPKVDLNQADAPALEALPGVGPATAAAIIAHRTEHGPFTSVDQLQDVAGIGPSKLARLRDLVRV